MKRLVLAFALLATPAFAQQTPTPEQYAGNLQVEISDGLTTLKSIITQQGQQIATLTKQTEADKKTIADLTAKVPAEKTEPAPAK